MTGFVDMHSHVIPGIDDGPPDLAQSIAMLRAAAESGVARIAATPHLRSDFPDVEVNRIADRCRELGDQARAEGIEIEIVPAGEVSLSWALEAPDEELALASYGQRGTDVLIETPLTTVVGLDALLYGIRARGYRVTLAHPERAREFQQDDAGLQRLHDQGVLLQVNASALLADPRRSSGARLGQRLCSLGLVHALASDGHRAREWRAVTELASAFTVAAELVGDERARWMLADAPGAIVAGREIPAPPEIAVPRSKRRWGWR
jgi:protein-tyrosine phosphatase